MESTVLAMARPPYVLEARQMGKTNLLLHIKKKREAEGDIVPYFDLSVRIDDVSSFFRYLIDSIINGTEQWQSVARTSIKPIRYSGIAEPHREYELSIIEILRIISPKRLVVIFDEIDSVVATNYSDRLFSQIRSMYFSRVNYSEYDRLTYILAGVAEPSELIKDRNISPFNIGEKIYLKDFTRGELCSFMGNAGFTFSDKVKDEVFLFTGGNPRMTWDVTSELEDIGLSNKHVSVGDVRNVVEKLYLQQFDRAPVDHIRVLAESDSDVRAAISSIRWGHGDEIHARTKSSLYLAGITKYDTNGLPVIKNPIIDAALSDEWLSTIAERERGPLRVATDQFRLGAYSETIRIISSFKSDDRGALPYDSQYQLALSLLYLNKNVEAVLEFRSLIDRPSEAERMMAAKYHYATALARSGDHISAIPVFREVAGTETKSSNVAKAGLIAALAAADTAESREEGRKVGHDVTRVAPSDDLDARQIVAASLYSLASIEAREGDSGAALAHLNTALSLAPRDQHPAILSRIFRLAPEAKNASLLETASEILLAPKGKSKTTFSDLDPGDRRIAEILSLLASIGRDDLIEDIINSRFGGQPQDTVRICLDLLRDLSDDFHSGITTYVWRKIHIQGETVPLNDHLESLRIISHSGPANFRSRALRDYMTLAFRVAHSDQPLPDEDLLFLLTQSQALINRNKLAKAFEIMDAIRAGVGPMTPDRAVVAFFTAYQDLNAARKMGDRLRSRRAAQYLTSMIAEYSEMLDESAAQFGNIIKAGKELAQEVLRETVMQIPRAITLQQDNPGKFGRNSRISVRDLQSGEEFTAKYKAVRDRILAGELVIVDEKK
ncbi:tetratricopeptide repeat protein [Mesorhizobium sp. M1027]